MKKIIVFLSVGLTFSGFAAANLSATVQLGSTDYQLSYGYQGAKEAAIDNTFLSRDLSLTYSYSPWDIKFGVKLGGLASEESSTDYGDFISEYTVKRDENSIFAIKNVYGIPITFGYYSSSLEDKVRDDDGYQSDSELNNDGFFVSGSYVRPLADKYGAFAKLGYQTSTVEEKTQYSFNDFESRYTQEGDGSAWVYGVGLYYILNAKSSILATYEEKSFSYEGDAVEEEMSSFAVAYSYNF